MREIRGRNHAGWLGSRKAPPFRPKSGAEPYQSLLWITRGRLPRPTAPKTTRVRGDFGSGCQKGKAPRSGTLEVFQNLRMVPQMELGKGSPGRRMGNPRGQRRQSDAAGGPGRYSGPTVRRPPISPQSNSVHQPVHFDRTRKNFSENANIAQ